MCILINPEYVITHSSTPLSSRHISQVVPPKVLFFFLMKYLIYFIIFAFCVGGASALIQGGSACLQHFFPVLRRRAPWSTGDFPVAVSDVLAAGPACLVVAGWVVYRNTEHGYIFQDIIGGGFLCQIQRQLRLPNIRVAAILLLVMFVFDIFWVFISPLLFRGKSVMVEVAKGGDTGEAVPMLLRVPSMAGMGGERLLGFGDIALPGLLASYLLRHDTLSKGGRRSFCSGYFAPCVVAYALGLVCTMVALAAMRMGQPALLYLVPATLGTTLFLGWRRGELRGLWDGVPSGSCPPGGRAPSAQDDDGDAERPPWPDSELRTVVGAAEA